MLWLHGPPGVGKSAIAQTVAERLKEENKLAATFFFSRRGDNNNAHQLFTTLAWQLAIYIPETRPHIDKVLTANPLIPEKSIEAQFNDLIIDPLKAAGITQADRVMIIDGVDECNDRNMQVRLLAIIKDAVVNNKIPLHIVISSRPEAQIRKTLMAPVGVVTPADSASGQGTRTLQRKIARRSSPSLLSTFPCFAVSFAVLMTVYLAVVRPISLAFETIIPALLLAGTLMYCIFLLPYRLPSTMAPITFAYLKKWAQEVRESWSHFQSWTPAGGSSISYDHETFLDQIVMTSGIFCLAIGRSAESEQDIKNYFRGRLVEISQERNLELDEWLSEEDLADLAKISCGQFIYASTVLRFIDDGAVHPSNKLEIVLRLRPHDSSPYPNLDQLYIEILKQENDRHFLVHLLAFLVMFSEHPLLKSGVGSGDEMPQNVPLITVMLNLQKGVIFTKLRTMQSLIKVSDTSVTVYHISFLEFLHRGYSAHYRMPCHRANRIFLKLLASTIFRRSFWCSVVLIPKLTHL